MNHLSSQQISQYLAGVLTPEQEVHAHECPLCGDRLARLESSLSHFRSSVRNLKETQSMTRMYSGNETMAGFTSLLIHCGVVALILLLSTSKTVQKMMKESVTLIAPSLKPYEAAKSGGGGGGGRSPIEASKGKAPKSAPKVFTPPRVDPTDSKLPWSRPSSARFPTSTRPTTVIRSDNWELLQTAQVSVAESDLAVVEASAAEKAPAWEAALAGASTESAEASAPR
jgi:hypothetical protein